MLQLRRCAAYRAGKSVATLSQWQCIMTWEYVLAVGRDLSAISDIVGCFEICDNSLAKVLSLQRCGTDT